MANPLFKTQTMEQYIEIIINDFIPLLGGVLIGVSYTAYSVFKDNKELNKLAKKSRSTS